MKNHYELLGVRRDATAGDIKRAFREQAKKLHPDIAGNGKEAETGMRRLLTAYEVLSNEQRRYEYDRAYTSFARHGDFNYRDWLRSRGDDASKAKLVFFELLHLQEDEAIEIWRDAGGTDFAMERHLSRGDWMDCAFILAEELDRRGCCREAFYLLVQVIREERRQPYFRLFTEDIEKYVREIVRLRLRADLDEEGWVQSLETLLTLGFPARDRRFWLKSLEQALLRLGDQAGARQVAEMLGPAAGRKKREIPA